MNEVTTTKKKKMSVKDLTTLGLLTGVLLGMSFAYYVVLSVIKLPYMALTIGSLTLALSAFELATPVFLAAMMVFLGVRNRAVLVFVPFLRGKARKAGTLFQYALTLWCLAQILPESLRLDDSLSVFVFARVTHLGLAVTVGVPLLRLLFVGRKRLSAKAIVLDVIGLAAGLGLAIGTIFALDKTNLPKLLVYAAMVLSFVELGFVICRRIHKEDMIA